jgi:glutamine cyclotransferase
MKIIFSIPFLLFIFLNAVLNLSCNSTTEPKPLSNEPLPKAISYSVLKAYPHDITSYTEGLEIYKGELYEGTGNFNESRLLKLDINTGKPIKQISLDGKYFGEGITILNDTVYQLTYREKTAFAYQVKDFKKIKEFSFTTDTKEGWGMTNDGKNLIVTDGSSNLYFFQPSNFTLIKKLPVTDAGSLSFNLNEIEYVDGFIYANQWQYNYILKIDAATGKIIAKADFTDLVNRVRSKNPTSEAFNGIAYDKATKKFFITGKYWPELYEIQFSN